MTVLFRVGTDGNGTVFYNIDCKKFKALKAQYRRAGWRVTDKGEQGKTFVIRLVELS